jgi:hypothetical protein
MFSKLLISTNVDPAFLAELRVYEHEMREEQEVHVVCSPTTACSLVGESDLVRNNRRERFHLMLVQVHGVKDICQRVECLLSYPIGVVIILSKVVFDLFYYLFLGCDFDLPCLE